MEFTNNLEPFLFDGFDCPQKLDSLDQAKVDDSWFLRKSVTNVDDHKRSSISEPSNEILSDRLSSIDEKENSHLVTSSENTILSNSNTSKSPASPHVATAPMAAAATMVVVSSSSTATNASAAAATEAAASPQELATESRCQLRSKWETLRLQRERRHEQLRKQRRDSMCRRDQERVQQLRAAAVPKAQPIRHYKPLRIRRSEKPLTVAKSPDFVLSRKERHNQNKQE